MRKLLIALLTLTLPGCVFAGNNGIRPAEQVAKHHWLIFALLGVFVLLFVMSSVVLILDGSRTEASGRRIEPNFGAFIVLMISIAMVLLLTG